MSVNNKPLTSLLGLLLGSTLIAMVACVSREGALESSLGRFVPIAPQNSGPAAPHLGAVLPRLSGSILITVAWPGRSLQFIPPPTKRFDLRATALGAAKPAATASLVFPAATASLGPIAEGPVTIAADAIDSGGAIVASGSVTVQVKANQSVPAKLILAPRVPLRIVSVSPVNGIAGDTITIGVAGAYPTLGIKVGGIETATQTVTLDGLGSGSVTVKVPGTLTGGNIELAVGGGLSTTSVEVFTRVASLNIFPLPPGNLAPGGLFKFNGTALAADLSSSVPIGGFTFAVRNAIDDSSVPTPQRRVVGTVDSVGLYTAASTGDDLVLFGRINAFTATATVKVR